MPKVPYQDVWRNGALVTKGRRECAERFAAINDRAGSPGSVVDVGGWDGYFSRRFAEAGAQVTLVEPRNVPDLPAGVRHRQERVDASTSFDSCDVALALAVLHHMDDWAEVLANLRVAGRLLIVEAPHPDELDGELSPTLVETGPRIGPLHEHALEMGKQFATTPGPNGVRRPLIAIENTLTGVVEDGVGRGYEAMVEHDLDVWAPLGYIPEPGTFNVRVGQQGKRWVRNLPRPVDLGAEGGTSTLGTYWPVTVGGVEAHARFSKSRTTVEVVAPVMLRDVLDVGSGGEVEIRPR